MKEIVLTKNLKIEETSDRTSLESKLFEMLFNETINFTSLHVQVNVEEIYQWVPMATNISNLESKLRLKVIEFFEVHSVDLSEYYINCRNYLSLPTFFSGVRVCSQVAEGKIYFVLFFNAHPHFHVSTIGSEILLSPLSNPGYIFHVDLTDSSIAISQMFNLMKR